MPSGNLASAEHQLCPAVAGFPWHLQFVRAYAENMVVEFFYENPSAHAKAYESPLGMHACAGGDSCLVAGVGLTRCWRCWECRERAAAARL